MSVARHLNIRLDEYDAKIRTFIPGYDEMLSAAAACLRGIARDMPLTVVDLGIGTGALAARCMQVLGAGTLIGIDADADILNVARERLATVGAHATFQHASFLDIDIPPADAIVASLSLHHVMTAERKRQLYADIRRALKPGGLFVTADCCPPLDAALARLASDAWASHLRRTYSEEDAAGFFAAWATEDRYFPLGEEVTMMSAAGLAPEVVWRQAPMAVIAARS